MKHFIGIDVGTKSVKAALVDYTGKILTTATQSIKIFEPQPNYYEQSSEDIWNACCITVKVIIFCLSLLASPSTDVDAYVLQRIICRQRHSDYIC